MKRILPSLLALSLAAPLAKAAKPAKGKDNPLQGIDTDRDGKISLAEFTAKHEGTMPKTRFKSADGDGDGFLSAAEFTAAKAEEKRREKAGDKDRKKGKKKGK